MDNIEPPSGQDGARVVAPGELAEIVKLLRNGRKWSQEQLAEITGLTVRTIQRIERGDPSNFDTRRALARAFDAADIDCFNNPFERICAEEAEAMTQKFKDDHVFLHAEVATGASLVKLAESSGADMFHAAEEMPRPAEEAFALLTDYWREYRDAHDLYTEVTKLEVRDDLQGYLDEMAGHGFTVRFADRPAALTMGPKGTEPLRTRIAYVVAFPKGKEPKELVVAKTIPREHAHT